MTGVETVAISCPYCWETIEVLVDPSIDHQEYIEDYSVCCRPMVLAVTVPAGEPPQVATRSEDE